MLNKVVQTLFRLWVCKNEIIKCDHSNMSYWRAIVMTPSSNFVSLYYYILYTPPTFRALECWRFCRFASPSASLRRKRSDCLQSIIRVSTSDEHKLNYSKLIAINSLHAKTKIKNAIHVQINRHKEGHYLYSICPLDHGEISTLTKLFTVWSPNVSSFCIVSVSQSFHKIAS